MRAPRWSIGVSLALALAGGGCDWRDFDSIQAHTPVLAVGAPSSFGADDFGRTIVPISKLPTGATGGRFVVAGAGAGALAIIDVDLAGGAKGQNVSSPALSTTQPVTALAEVPGTAQVLLGVPGDGTVSVMTMGATPDVALLDAPPAADRFGMGVAAGQLAGGAAPDFVVASGVDLTVYVDGAATMAVPAASSADCPMAIPQPPTLPARDQLRRPVLVASLMGGAGAQIVVGTPSASDAGAVNVFTVDATGLATCQFSYRSADHRFGHALATGDFNGDGVLDLLIGSPPSHAFWIPGPLTKDSAVLPVTLAAGAGELGSTVAAANLDGQPGDEALIGNPDATVGGAELAGEVRIVSGARLDKELPVLRRHAPGANDVFGITVSPLPFCKKAGCAAADVQTLALVGSASHALTYFLLVGATDPRTP